MKMKAIPMELIPQADHLPRLVDVVSVIVAGKTTASEIAAECDISRRQAGYYELAGISVKLLRRVDGEPHPT